MRMRYHHYSAKRGLQKLKTRTAIAISAIGLIVSSGFGLGLSLLSTAHADSSSLINFEQPAYSLGNINGQNGWSKTGAYDAAVVSNTYGYTTFGAQNLRISNAVTSGSFGDQTFAPSLSQPAGEPNALDKNGNPVASPLPHFEAQFDIASTTGAEQPGMAMSVSPDNGVGARMSYLRFVDQTDGMHVFFDDATDPSHGINQDQFNESDVATLSYAIPHIVKFSMDFNAGPDNDVVRVYIDGKLVKVGTSWEDYYLYDTESNPSLNNNSRVVTTMLFREGGTAMAANAGKGYLIDNLSYLSGQVPSTQPGLPNSKDQCMNNGWKNFGGAFKNQGDCVSFVASKGKNQPTGTTPAVQNNSLTATGNVTLSGPTQYLSFTATDNGPSFADQGTVHYQNPSASLTYDAPLTCVNVFGNTAFFAYVIPSGNPYAGTWVVWKATDGSPDTATFAVAADENSANALCESGTGVTGSYPVVAGDIVVQ